MPIICGDHSKYGKLYAAGLLVDSFTNFSRKPVIKDTKERGIDMQMLAQIVYEGGSL